MGRIGSGPTGADRLAVCRSHHRQQLHRMGMPGLNDAIGHREYRGELGSGRSDHCADGGGNAFRADNPSTVLARIPLRAWLRIHHRERPVGKRDTLNCRFTAGGK